MQTGHPDEAISSGLYEDGSTYIDGRLKPRVLARCSCCPKVITRGAPPNLPLQVMDRWVGQQHWRIISGESRERRYVCPSCVKHHRRPFQTTTLDAMTQALNEAAARKQHQMSTTTVFAPHKLPSIIPTPTKTPPWGKVGEPVEVRLSISGKHAENSLWYQLRIPKVFLDKLPPDKRKVTFLRTNDMRLVLQFGSVGANPSMMKDRFYLVRPLHAEDVVAPSRQPCVYLNCSFDGGKLVTDEPLPLAYQPRQMRLYQSPKEEKMLIMETPVKSVSPVDKREVTNGVKDPAVDLKAAITMVNEMLDEFGPDEVTLKLTSNRLSAVRRIVKIIEEVL